MTGTSWAPGTPEHVARFRNHIAMSLAAIVSSDSQPIRILLEALLVLRHHRTRDYSEISVVIRALVPCLQPCVGVEPYARH
jgi:hypothetical protein